jgi:hypothetical protein
MDCEPILNAERNWANIQWVSEKHNIVRIDLYEKDRNVLFSQFTFN